MSELKQTMQRARELIAANLAECCRDELDWQKSSILRDGKLREAAAIFGEVDKTHAIPMAQSETARQAMQLACRTQPEATKPAQDLSAAILARPPGGAVSELAAFQYWAACQDEPISPISAWNARAALASPADALEAGDRVDAVKCWKDRMASPQNREWRGAMEEAMEAEIMELRMVLSSNKVDAERYRYIRDTATLDNAVWEALEGYGMTNGAGELLEDEYRAGMDRAIDRAIQAQKDGHAE